MITNLSSIQSSTAPFQVTATFSTNLVVSPSSLASVTAGWGPTPDLGNTATGTVVGLNPDGSIGCRVVIPADQSVDANYFTVTATDNLANTDTSTLNVLSTVDHVAKMQGQLLGQYKNLPNLAKLIKVFGFRLQQAHTVLDQVRLLRSLRTAQAGELDGLAQRLGRSRGGLSDADLLTFLQSVVIAFNGQATADDLIDISNLLGRPEFMTYFEPGNASVIIMLANPDPITSATDVVEVMKKSKLAGVELRVLSAPLPIFAFSGATGPHYAGFGVGHLAGPLS